MLIWRKQNKSTTSAALQERDDPQSLLWKYLLVRCLEPIHFNVASINLDLRDKNDEIPFFCSRALSQNCSYKLKWLDIRLILLSIPILLSDLKNDLLYLDADYYTYRNHCYYRWVMSGSAQEHSWGVDRRNTVLHSRLDIFVLNYSISTSNLHKVQNLTHLYSRRKCSIVLEKLPYRLSHTITAVPPKARRLECISIEISSFFIPGNSNIAVISLRSLDSWMSILYERVRTSCVSGP